MTGALSLLAGVLLGMLTAAAVGPAWQWAAAALLAVFVASSWRHRAGPAACALLLGGQLLASLHVNDWLERRVPVGGADARLLVEGVIATVPARDGATLRFDLREDGRLLRVQWRDPHATPRVGERWRLLLRQLPLEESRNFAGGDVARLAFRDGVHGAGRVLPSAMNALLALAPDSLDTRRARIAARIRESIADPDAAALVTALAVGLTADMSRDQWRVFNATGTTHLVAISGLHVTLFAWLAFRVARLAWRWLPGRRRVAREAFALSSGLVAAGGYALLAGLSVPTQRTWIMLALYVAGRLAARVVGPGRLWAVALVLVLLTDARAPLAAGFWLSFIAVGVLLAFAGPAAPDPTTRGWALVRVQILVMVALAPATFAIFGGVSVVGLLVNLVAIPLISLLFVPVVLVGVLVSLLAPAYDALAFSLAAALYEWLWPALVACADLEWGPLRAGWKVSPPAWWYLLALPATLLWLSRGPWPLRATAACAVLPLAFAPPDAPPMAAARVEIFDAGRGVAVLLRTRSHALLFDTGDTWNTRGARLAERVLPALDAAGLRRVDRLVLPTLDADRARAAALLALERQVAGLSVGGGWPGSGADVRCRDARWTWDGVAFMTYAAGRHCLLRVSVNGHGLLFPGDLDAAGERALLARLAPGELASDVVIVGRQVSDLASSPRWIESTAPGLAVATGGIARAQSRQRVLDRWRRVARVIDTHEAGALKLVLDARGVAVQASARAARYPFHWRRPSPV